MGQVKVGTVLRMEVPSLLLLLFSSFSSSLLFLPYRSTQLPETSQRSPDPHYICIIYDIPGGWRRHWCRHWCWQYWSACTWPAPPEPGPKPPSPLQAPLPPPNSFDSHGPWTLSRARSRALNMTVRTVIAGQVMHIRTVVKQPWIRDIADGPRGQKVVLQAKVIDKQWQFVLRRCVNCCVFSLCRRGCSSLSAWAMYYSLQTPHSVVLW